MENPENLQQNVPELTGNTDCITYHHIFSSSPRIQMSSSECQQAVMPLRPDVPITMTGFERQMVETTMNISVANDCIVESIIPRYQGRRNRLDAFVPKVIVVQNTDDGRYDLINLENYYKGHPIFGIIYKLTMAGRGLRPGLFLKKGTILASSPGAQTSGVYTTTLSPEFVNISINGTIEDGFCVSEDFLKRAAPISIVTRDGSVGKDRYFVGLYSSGDNFKAFPGYGESVRDDNLIFATRPYDELLDSIYMLDDMINEPDPCFDESTYLPQDAWGGTVIGIQLFRSPPSTRLRRTPKSMEKFLDQYAGEQNQFNTLLIQKYRDLKRREGSKLVLDASLDYEVTMAMGSTPSEITRLKGGRSSSGVRYTVKTKVTDEWRVVLQTAWISRLEFGSKIADMSGCKGTTCEIRPASEMPRDNYGNVAEIAQFGAAIYRRMTLGPEYERYINGACRDVSKDVRKMVAENRYEDAYRHAMGLIEIISPTVYTYYQEHHTTDAAKRDYVDHICDDIIRAVIPPSSPHLNLKLIGKIMEYRRPDKGPVHYRNYNGQWETTKDDILIAPKQVMVLDKSSFGPMAVAASRLQQHGLPTTSNQRTKNDSPTNRKAPRSLGESEVRNMCANIGGWAVSYILDWSTDPDKTNMLLESMMSTDKPFLKDFHIDQSKYPPGRSRAVMFLKNVLSCIGAKLSTYITDRGDSDE